MTEPKPSSATPPLHVAVDVTPEDRRQFEFRAPFRIGRVEPCEICIQSEYVSRNHAEVTVEDGQWVVRDLQSRNGIYLNGQRADNLPIQGPTRIRLGIQGPFVTFTPQTVSRVRPAPPPAELKSRVMPPSAPVSPTHPTVPFAKPDTQTGSMAGSTPVNEEEKIKQYIERYFNTESDAPAGEHTMMVRQAFSKVQAKQKRKYGWIVGALSILVVAIGGYAFWQYRELRERKKFAQDLFYEMKAIDVSIGQVESKVTAANSQEGKTEIARFRDQRKSMEERYDRFLKGLKIYDTKVTPEERLILRVARIFGECELAAPPDFVGEVKKYIKYWQSTPRFRQAIRTAQMNNYTPLIGREFLKQGLPPQFFYLALQESGFDQYACGPPTYKGIAKGMWQFIPETGLKFGLKPGPLVDLNRADPGDDRHHWDLATPAAAKYIKELYTTDAQASGFLVMACYNWGEGKVVPLVNSLPANPRERNFWKLLAAYREKIPPETYNYVFYIISAAVIGEDPQLFGFDFPNPLAFLETR